MSGIAAGRRERRLIAIMGEAGKEIDAPIQPVEVTPKDGRDLAESIKARLSPAVDMWVNLIADAIADTVLQEHRRNAECQPADVGESAGEPRRPERARLPRDDYGKKVPSPRGRLLTIQEAAEYLGLSPRSLAGRGWRMKNRLPAIRVGRSVRSDKEALDRWIDRHRERLPRSFGTMEDQ
jgi:excisionase family DNA binding protein